MMKNSRPLLVFDLDGTLVDSAGDLMGTLNFVLQQNGIAPLPVEKAHSLLGAGGRALIQRGFAAQGESLDEARLDTLFTAFINHYTDNIAINTRLYPGVPEALDRLADAGFRFAVCTNKLEALAVKLLRELSFAERFDAICGQDSAVIDGKSVQKPDPRALFHAIERAGGHREKAIMIGDSKTDIATAKAARLPSIGVDFGYTDIPMRELGADYVISHFEALWDAVMSLEAVAP